MKRKISRVRLCNLETKTFIFPLNPSFNQLIDHRFHVLDREAILKRFQSPMRKCSRRRLSVELLECSFKGASTIDVLDSLSEKNFVSATLAQTLHILKRDRYFIDHRPVICLGSVKKRQGVWTAPLIYWDGADFFLLLSTLENKWWDPYIIHAIKK